MKRLIYIFALLVAFAGCKSKSDALVGAYGKGNKVTAEERAVFSQAMNGDTFFTPEKVRKQVVAGVNYEFFCVDEDGKPHTILIFKPLPGRGEPRVVSIDGELADKASFRMLVYYKGGAAKERLLAFAGKRGDRIARQCSDCEAVVVEVTSCHTKEEAHSIYSKVEGVHHVVEDGVMNGESSGVR